MNSAESTATVTALRHPAVHATTLVRSDVAHTFDAFVRTIATWWPVERLSAGRERVRDVTLEPRVGGRVYETWDDGTTAEWGEILAWDPPRRFTMTWNSTPLPTEVELTFTELGPALTRVTVEHRGWEALSDDQLREDCGSPGGYSGGAFDRGWRLALDSFSAAVHLAAVHALIDDDYMRDMRATTLEYSFLLLNRGPNWDHPDRDAIIWEHGRRNFALRAQGVLAIVCPVVDDSERCGIGIFNATVDETEHIYRDDPAVQAGVMTFEVHPVRSFPGDQLPAHRVRAR